MKSKVEQMICTLLPGSVPDEDFKVVITPDNHAEIVYWNDYKLGAFPGLAKLREIFLEYAKKRKAKMPDFDDSDPLPYMAEPQEKSRRMIQIGNLPVVDVTTMGGATFIRKKQ
jgi:hypothetical protein